MGRDLQFVLKVAERCNIDCTYCYYLNSGNDSPFSRPAFMDEQVARGVVDFALKSQDTIEVGKIRIVLHGGEPLMLKKKRFRGLCNVLSELQRAGLDSEIAMTTNAMLVDEEWIDIFAEYQIGVGISLDGPQEYHDLERVDFRGRGTHSRVMFGVNALLKAAAQGQIKQPGVLAVIDPRGKGDVVYDYLIRQLGFRNADFMMPFTIHDWNPKEEDVNAVARFLIAAFWEWVKDDNPKIRIRTFNKYLNRILACESEKDRNPDHIVVGVGSDGTIVNDDIMQVLGPDIFDRGLNVCKSSMDEYLAELQVGKVVGVAELAQDCKDCYMLDVCRPSTLPWDGAEMRYKKETGFQNRLVHCSAIQDLVGEMQAYVASQRVPLSIGA